MSTINAEELHSKLANKSVTVPELYSKVHETSPALTSIVSPSGKVVTVEAIYNKVNEGTGPTIPKAASFNAVMGDSYRIVAANVVATLPLGANQAVGSSAKFSKLVNLTAVIKASGSDLITINTKVGDSVLFDANVEPVIVWNGSGWEA